MIVNSKRLQNILCIKDEVQYTTRNMTSQIPGASTCSQLLTMSLHSGLSCLTTKPSNGPEGLRSQSSLLQKMQVSSILSGAVAFQKTLVSLILSGVVAEGLATSQLAPLAQPPPILTSNLLLAIDSSAMIVVVGLHVIALDN